jgi:hypothetical protein
MLDGLAKYGFDEDRSSQRWVMAPSQVSVSAQWVSTSFETDSQIAGTASFGGGRGFLIRVVVGHRSSKAM